MSPEKRRIPYLEVFMIGLFIAFSFLLPYMLMDHGLFLFYGDYDVEQVPFYMLAHQAIRSGSWLWSWTTDLGSAFIPSYSFYLLGSPFFWLTVPLPQNWVPYTMGPLLALKIALCAVTAFAYIRRFAKRDEFAALGGLLYAFSSFSIYNIFFNHFHDVMVFFPLLLIALEEYMQHDRRGVFAVTVFFCAIINYNFFFGEVLFVLIYWALRLSSGEWKLTPAKFAFLALEAVLGLGISSILLLPSVLSISGNYRTGQILTGWGMLVYDNNQRLPDILHSLFFPQDLPSRPNFFPDANNKWASIAAWLPMFSCSGALAFFMAKKGHWLKRILGLSLLMAVIPGLNAAFYMLNSEYYARWFYMPVLLMCLATTLALEDPAVDFGPGLLWTGAVTLAFALTIGLLPSKDNKGKIRIGLETYPFRFWVTVLIVLGGLVITAWLIRRYGKNTLAFANAATIALTLVVCIYANFFVANGKTYGFDPTWVKNNGIEGGSQLKLDRSTFFRADVLYYGNGDYPGGMDNQAMFWGLPTIQAFQSTVSNSILKFYPTVGVSRDVASRVPLELAGLRPLLSVKYLFDGLNSTSLSVPGWKYDNTQLGFKIWENENYIPMGFAFDHYINSNSFALCSSKDRMLLKALVLTNQQIARYGDILSALPDQYTDDFSDIALKTDCDARRSMSCSSFQTDNTGFTAKISLPQDRLVFFSVPYDKGWSATVGGKTARIEEVDSGFMAVLVPAGNDVVIRFNYMTPGLKTGGAVTAGAILLLIAYLVLFNVVFKKRLLKPAAPAAVGTLDEPDYDNDPDGDEG